MHLDPVGRTVESDGDGTPRLQGHALFSFGIILNLVLILHNGESLPQDNPIEETEVTIVVIFVSTWEPYSVAWQIPLAKTRSALPGKLLLFTHFLYSLALEKG